MKFTKTSVGGTVEILAADDYTAIPIKVAGSSVVKAGMPMKYDGTSVAAGTASNGILLYDVDPNENPNGSLIVAGVVYWANCKSHSGSTATAATLTGFLPAFAFLGNIRRNSLVRTLLALI